MPIRLEITFTGLFLFVPDTQNGRLHVVLPETGFGNVHPHTATIKKLGSKQEYEFGEEDLDLVGTGTGANKLIPPTEVVDLRQITTKGLEGDQVRKSGKQKNVYARITFPGATSMRPGPSARYNVPVIGEKALTHQVDWILDDFNRATAVFNRIKYDKSSAELIEFHPDGDVIRLCLQHLPEHEEPTPNFEAKHFEAYYKVYKASVGKGNPLLLDTPTTMPVHPCLAEGRKKFASDSTFTCMTAQVEPD